MTEAIARQDPQQLAGRYELTVQEIIAQAKKIEEVIREAMEKGVHYGVIPGTPKPTLYKAGAEKLLLLFRLDPQYQSVETFEGEHLMVKSVCTLYHITTGQRFGSGEGSCSTRESRYAWRKAERVCPACGSPAIIKGKADYGGGWLCFAKKGGCGVKFKDGDASIETQEVWRIPNPDIADQYNTVLKMANKRSLVAAVLNCTAASDVFTQDMEDMPTPEPRGTATEDAPGTVTVIDAPPTAEGSAPITEPQVRKFFAIARGHGWTDDERHDLLTSYGVGKVEEIPAAKFNAVLERLKSRVAK